jgi:hypothetical protein
MEMEAHARSAVATLITRTLVPSGTTRAKRSITGHTCCSCQGDMSRVTRARPTTPTSTQTATLPARAG